MKILVVDRNSDQIETICRGLSLSGYTNISAHNCDEAREVLRNDSDNSINLVITDIAAENSRNGLDLIENILEERPAIKIIVTTGLKEIPGIEKIRKLGIPVLRKPFSHENLGDSIRTLFMEESRESA